MRILIQRVSSAKVRVEDRIVGQIQKGLVLLVGIETSDDERVMTQMARKISGMRIFSDEKGRFQHSVCDVGGGLLVVSQFTLFADTKKGRRPSFGGAASAEMAESAFDRFVDILRTTGVEHIATGVFGAHMDVEINNAGPVTIWMDSQAP